VRYQIDKERGSVRLLGPDALIVAWADKEDGWVIKYPHESALTDMAKRESRVIRSLIALSEAYQPERKNSSYPLVLAVLCGTAAACNRLIRADEWGVGVAQPGRPGYGKGDSNARRVASKGEKRRRKPYVRTTTA
jgi:hypothetical protein